MVIVLCITMIKSQEDDFGPPADLRQDGPAAEGWPPFRFDEVTGEVIENDSRFISFKIFYLPTRG